MITSHLIETNHLLTSDTGSELYLVIQHDSEKASLIYKASKDGDKVIIEVDSLPDLTAMLNEAVKLTTKAVG
jgi:hypothetical protein